MPKLCKFVFAQTTLLGPDLIYYYPLRGKVLSVVMHTTALSLGVEELILTIKLFNLILRVARLHIAQKIALFM